MVALADSSAFLDPPEAEIPAIATPDPPARQRIMTLAVSYVRDMIPHLPDFFAVRDTTHFEDRPQEDVQSDTGMISYSFQPLHITSKSSVTVTYRNGKEVVETGKGSKRENELQGLIPRGEFGPILGTVLVDASHGKLTWSYWEQGVNGPLAVFPN